MEGERVDDKFRISALFGRPPDSDGASDVTVDGGFPSPSLRVLIRKMRRVISCLAPKMSLF